MSNANARLNNFNALIFVLGAILVALGSYALWGWEMTCLGVGTLLILGAMRVARKLAKEEKDADQRAKGGGAAKT